MAIKAYVGRMGSGKSYEVVSEVILGALRRGRRVVSNVAGLDYSAMVALLESEGIAADSVGQLLMVSHDDVVKPNFWRTDKEGPDADVVIQPGDLVALDEIWRFWRAFDGKEMPERVMNFFRMHRHMTHPETGVACDVALITQDVMDISRRVRAVIEETYRMEKLTAIGSTKRYRVDIHRGGKVMKSALIRQLQRSYDPKYFALYKSHSGAQEGAAGPVEENIDDRGNLLKGAMFKIGLPVGVLVAIVAVFMVMRFFKGPADKAPTVSKAAESIPVGVEKASKAPDVEESAEWRVAGFYAVGGSPVFVLLGSGGAFRGVADSPAVKLSALSTEVRLPSGQFATSWALSRSENGPARMVGK